MISKLKTFIAITALSVSVGAKVQAAELPVIDSENSQVQSVNKKNIQAWNPFSDTELLDILSNRNYGHVITTDAFMGIIMNLDGILKEIDKKNDIIPNLIPEINLTGFAEDLQEASEPEDNESNSKTDNNPAVTKENTAAEKTAEETDEASAEQTTTTAAIETPIKEEPAVAKPQTEATQQESKKEITVSATAYTANCDGCSGVTATGIDIKANPSEKVIAVDPDVIPLGSKVYVEGYGEAIAGDVGGAIDGNEIDVFIPANDEALEWGRKEVTVTIIED